MGSPSEALSAETGDLCAATLPGSSCLPPGFSVPGAPSPVRVCFSPTGSSSLLVCSVSLLLSPPGPVATQATCRGSAPGGPRTHRAQAPAHLMGAASSPRSSQSWGGMMYMHQRPQL